MMCVQVGFALGGDGEPWVWVMGEHRDDLPYEQLVSISYPFPITSTAST